MPPSAPSRAAEDKPPEERPIRVMIVDDSAIARAVLARMISAEPDMDVVAFATSGPEAVDALQSVRVDVILLDVEMPGGSGVQALPAIIERAHGAKVLIVSSSSANGVEEAVRALGLGAADTLPKPGAGAFFGRFSQILHERIRRIGRAGASQPLYSPPRASAAAAMKLRPMPERRTACLALGGSTGGIHAIAEFFRALPTRINAPLIVTQHLPPEFMPYFAREIARVTARPVHVAREGASLEPDVVLIAPGDAHLGLAQVGSRIEVRLSRARASSGCLPSVDAMLAAAAEIYGRSAVGVVFSGIGRDGLAGSQRLVARGGAVLVQNADSSAVWGMPRAVAEAGLASAILAPAELGRRVAAHAEAFAWK